MALEWLQGERGGLAEAQEIHVRQSNGLSLLFLLLKLIVVVCKKCIDAPMSSCAAVI